MTTKTKLKIGAAVLVLCGLIYVSQMVVYSEGHRDGYVQKFSKKGLAVRTYEGELRQPLQRVADQGSADTSSVWHFTVSDPKVVKAVDTVNARQLVRLYYKEYLWKPIGETNYRITKLQVLEE